MKVLAVIDRFEGQQAVLSLEGTPPTLVVPRRRLPSRAQAGDCLQLEMDGERLVRARLDPGGADGLRARIEEKLARLRRGAQM